MSAGFHELWLPLLLAVLDIASCWGLCMHWAHEANAVVDNAICKPALMPDAEPLNL